MITEKDLQEAIAECQGQRNPNANTCIKLAAFLTIQRELYPQEEPMQEYSFAPAPDGLISYGGESKFAKIIDGRKQEEIIPVMDELMDALSIVNPRLYDSVIRKLQ